MNKKAERREKWPRTELRLWLGGEKRFILPPKAAFCSLSRDQCCSINCASLYRVNVMKKDSIYPQTQEYDLFCHTKAFCHSKRSQNNIQTPYTSTKMNEMSWEREESPRVGLSLWLGGEKRFILPPKAAFCCSHMINIAVSIVQVISVRPRAWQKPSSLIQDAVDRHQTHQTYNKKEWSQLNLELNHLALYRGLVWWVKNWIIHPPKAAFIAVLYCMHGQRDEKGLNLSPKCKNKFIFVITKPSLNHNEV